MKQPTQKEKILKAFRDANGAPISSRYFKQTLLISECNGRISELRGEGYEIETLPEPDEFGFARHVLKSEPKKAVWEYDLVDGVRKPRLTYV